MKHVENFPRQLGGSRLNYIIGVGPPHWQVIQKIWNTKSDLVLRCSCSVKLSTLRRYAWNTMLFTRPKLWIQDLTVRINWVKWNTNICEQVDVKVCPDSYCYDYNSPDPGTDTVRIGSIRQDALTGLSSSRFTFRRYNKRAVIVFPALADCMGVGVT